MISALHQGEVTAHITMGGHYPGFDHAEVRERMPHLDSIVRFEGEATLVELLDRLDAGDDWHGVTGIAYQSSSKAVANPLRSPTSTRPYLHLRSQK